MPRTTTRDAQNVWQAIDDTHYIDAVCDGACFQTC